MHPHLALISVLLSQFSKLQGRHRPSFPCMAAGQETEPGLDFPWLMFVEKGGVALSVRAGLLCKLLPSGLHSQGRGYASCRAWPYPAQRLGCNGSTHWSIQ